MIPSNGKKGRLLYSFNLDLPRCCGWWTHSDLFEDEDDDIYVRSRTAMLPLGDDPAGPQNPSHGHRSNTLAINYQVDIEATH